MSQPPHYRQHKVEVKKRWPLNKIKLTWEKKTCFRWKLVGTASLIYHSQVYLRLLPNQLMDQQYYLCGCMLGLWGNCCNLAAFGLSSALSNPLRPYQSRITKRFRLFLKIHDLLFFKIASLSIGSEVFCVLPAYWPLILDVGTVWVSVPTMIYAFLLCHCTWRWECWTIHCLWILLAL